MKSDQVVDFVGRRTRELVRREKVGARRKRMGREMRREKIRMS